MDEITKRFIAKFDIRLERVEDEYLWADVIAPDGSSMGGHGYEIADRGYREASSTWVLSDRTDLKIDYAAAQARSTGVEIPAQWLVGDDEDSREIAADNRVYDALIDACEDALSSKAAEIRFFEHTS
jgi:hypothetical protein